MPTLNKLDLSLAGVNLSRIEMKTYSQKYTDIPNHVLPVDLLDKVSTIYTALSGNEFTDEVKTFTVGATEEGKFRALYTPSILGNALGQNLIIQWGQEQIFLNLQDGGISSDNTKLKWAFISDKFGKYERQLLKLTIPINGSQYVVSIPLRLQRVEEGQEQVDVDTLTFLVEEGNYDELFALFQDISDRKSSKFMTGYSAKAGQLPLGTYRATQYNSKDHPQYGMMYFLQFEIVELDEGDSFELETRVPAVDKNGDSVLNAAGKRVYEPATVTVNSDDKLIVKANTGLKNLILSKPIMSEESPVMITVYDHGEFNGHKTAKLDWEVTKFRQEEGALNPSF